MTEVLLFTQETCGACTTQRENDEGIEDAYPDVEFREIDVQTDPETAEAYGVRKTPTTLVYANGERTDGVRRNRRARRTGGGYRTRRPAIDRTRTPARQHRPRMTEANRSDDDLQ